MPPPINLVGRVLGDLTVIKNAGFTSGKRRYPVWLCRCKCGREEEIPSYRLPCTPSNAKKKSIRWACYTCTKGPCVHCGGPITRKTNGNTCSEKCHAEHRQQQWRDSYYRQVESDPDFNKKRAAVNRERINSDPDYAAKARLWEQQRIKKRSERLLTDPEFAEKQRERHRQWYERNRESKLAQNRLNYYATPIEKRREYAREYAAKRREQIYADPDWHKEYRVYQRQKGREHWQRVKQQEAIREFRDLVAKLNEAKEADDE